MIGYLFSHMIGYLFSHMIGYLFSHMIGYLFSGKASVRHLTLNAIVSSSLSSDLKIIIVKKLSITNSINYFHK